MSSLPEEILFTYIIAIIIAVLFVIFIIAFVFLYKKRQTQMLVENDLKESELQNEILAKELEKIKEIQRERERIGFDLHDDIGARLSAINMELQYFMKQNSLGGSDFEDIIEQSKELSSTMREIVWSLNTQYDTLESFLFYVKEYAFKYFEKSPIEVECHLPAEIIKHEMGSLLRRNLFLSIKESLHNVLKHSKASKVQLQAKHNDQSQLIIEINDNGIGFTAENDFGNGLISIRNRMKAIGGEIKILNEQGVRITLIVSL